ncbi:G-protein coupled receptor 161-like [Glandiceps talaboti]
MAGNETDEYGKHSTVVVVTVIYILTILFTMVGNLTALLVICRTKELREVTRIFMANLAVTDLLVGVLILPCIIHTAITEQWEFGYYWCQFTGFCNLLLCSVSALSLTAVSYERFVVIVHPLRYVSVLTFKKSVVAITFIWIYGALGASGPLFGIGRQALSSHVVDSASGEVIALFLQCGFIYGYMGTQYKWK